MIGIFVISFVELVHGKTLSINYTRDSGVHGFMEKWIEKLVDALTSEALQTLIRYANLENTTAAKLQPGRFHEAACTGACFRPFRDPFPLLHGRVCSFGSQPRILHSRLPMIAAAVAPATSWPRLVVFNLDFTLWRPELFQLDKPVTPVTQLPSGGVKTAANEHLDLFPAARRALLELADAGVPVAVASRTHLDQAAHEVMKRLRVDKARTVADCIGGPIVIRSGSKQEHFRQIELESGVPLELMLFFDNEHGNIVDCEALGVTCAYCPKGLTEQVFREGLQRHAQETSSRLKRGAIGKGGRTNKMSEGSRRNRRKQK